MRKSEGEVKTNTKKTIASWLANHSCLPCRKKIVIMNTKDHFKSVLCAATAFFVLVTSRQPVFQNCSEIFFICCPNVKKPQNCFLFYIWLFFCYLSIIIANHTCYAMGRQGELLVKLIFSNLTSKQQSVCQSRNQVIQMMCATYVFRMSRNSIFD